MKMLKQGRIGWVDELRGFAIILVTMGHAFGYLGRYSSFLRYFIYSFHMPLFFGISGFCAGLSNSPKLLRRFCALMIPYFVWSFLAPLIYTGFGDVSREFLADNLRLTLIDNKSYWFLPCLFLLLVSYSCFSYLSEKFPARKSLLVDLSIILFIQAFAVGIFAVSRNQFARSWFSYVLPFFFGVLIARHDLLARFTARKLVLVAAAFLVFAGLFVVFARIRSESYVGVKVFRMIAGLSSIPLLFVAFKRGGMPVAARRCLAQIGQFTLLIYVLNDPLLPGISLQNVPEVLVTLVACVVVAFVLLQDWVLAKIIGLNELASWVLLGKPSRKAAGLQS